MSSRQIIPPLGLQKLSLGYEEGERQTNNTSIPENREFVSSETSGCSCRIITIIGICNSKVKVVIVVVLEIL